MGNTEGTPEPGDAVETRRGASVDTDQLQRDYDAAGGLRQLAEMYGMGRRAVRRLLVEAGITIQSRGCNGSKHSEAWYAALERRRTEQGDEIRAIMAKARAVRWADPNQHERASERLREVWATDQAWRDRHMETLRRLWDDPAQPLRRQWDDPEQRERQRQAWLRRIAATRGRTGTPPGEVELHNALKRASVSFTTSVVVLNGAYIVDVLIHQRPLVIEADGISHIVGDNASKDAERESEIKAAGYEVARFTYGQLAKDADLCVASLRLEPEENPVFTVREHMDGLHELQRIRNRQMMV